MFKNISIIRKLNSETSVPVEAVSHVVEIAASRAGVPIDYGRKQSDTLLVAIGGDGTMLEAMRQSALTGARCIGINLGRVGFLTDLCAEDNLPVDLHDRLISIMTGKANTWVEERRLLVTDINDRPKLAGNEISVSTKFSDSMICYQLKIGNMVAGIHRANSVMVTTATGSTAYSLSAGGALMMPDLRSMQIVPVAPLTLTSRPIVVPSHVQIEITAWGGPVSVRLDGQVRVSTDNEYTKENPYVIYVNTYSQCAKLLHMEGWNYFDVLTQKLGWIHE